MTTPAPNGQTILPDISELVKALIAAQGEIQGVVKDKRNDFHRYNYASAEGMYRTCREILGKHGLWVIPCSTTIRTEMGPVRIPLGRNKDPESHEGHAVLVSTFLLTHTSGQKMPLSREWPIVPEKGRPFDKASAAADTASMSYMLRDLLLIPRVEEGTDLDDPSRDKPGDEPQKATGRQIKHIIGHLDRLGVPKELSPDAPKGTEHPRARALRRVLQAERALMPDQLTMREAEHALEALETMSPSKEPAKAETATEKPEQPPAEPPSDETAKPEPPPEKGAGLARSDPEPDPPRYMATEMQMRAIRSLFDDLKIPPSSEARQKVIKTAAGVDVGRLDQLTEFQAKQAIVKLEAEKVRRAEKVS